MLVLLIWAVLIRSCQNTYTKNRERNELVTLETPAKGHPKTDFAALPVEDKSQRHYSARQLKKLQTLKRRCANKRKSLCNLPALAKEIVSFNVKDRSHLMKGLFNSRYCFNQTSFVQYDPEEELCCNGVHRRLDQEMQCCGGRIINTTQDSCCNDNIHRRSEHIDCCGRNMFDKRTHLCCNGFLHVKLDGTACCGEGVYTRQRQLCCYDRHSVNITENEENECCGEAAYNSKTSICCERNVYTKGGKEQCCRNLSYPVDCFQCKHGNIEPVYNETSYLCCDGRVASRTFGPFTGCCLGKVYNSSQHTCSSSGILTSIDPAFNTDVEEEAVDRDSTNLDETDDDTQSENEHTNNTNVGLVAFLAGTILLAILAIVVVLVKRRTKKHNTDTSVESVMNNSEYQFQNETPDGNLEDTQDSTPNEYVSGLPSNDHHVSEVKSLNGDFMKALQKTQNINHDNLSVTQFKESFSQTGPCKESNRRTIFGKPFDHSYVLGKSKATVQMEHSEVQMTLPRYLLQHSDVEVNCSSFSSILSLREKLGLFEDEKIASPVVEYSLSGVGKLQEHALVKMPFFGPIDKLKVRKFQSDEGLNSKACSEDIPMQEKANKDLDSFFIVHGGTVLIYTKSFSGFFCTTSRHNRPLQLKSFLFGSFKRLISLNRFEVRISLYIADELMKFDDYKERMFKNEDVSGRLFKGEKEIFLPETLSETDEVKVSLTPMEQGEHWLHMTRPVGNEAIFEAVQTFRMKDIATKCKDCQNCHLLERDIPFKVEWYMVNVEGIIPCYTFQCLVDVNIGDCTTPMMLDELQLRQEDRYPAEDSRLVRNMRGIKEYLAQIDAEKRTAVISSLTSRLQCASSSIEEIFEKLQEKYKPYAALELVVSSLKEKLMFDELDVLAGHNLVPSSLTATAVQPVCQAFSEHQAEQVPAATDIGHTRYQQVPAATDIGHTRYQQVPAATDIGHTGYQHVPATTDIGHTRYQRVPTKTDTGNGAPRRKAVESPSKDQKHDQQPDTENERCAAVRSELDQSCVYSYNEVSGEQLLDQS